jgi:hypothetical protein
MLLPYLRGFLARARVVALCFPLYGLVSSFAQGCGGGVHDGATSQHVGGDSGPDTGGGPGPGPGPDGGCIEEGYGYGYGYGLSDCDGDDDGYGYGYGYSGCHPCP